MEVFFKQYISSARRLANSIMDSKLAKFPSALQCRISPTECASRDHFHSLDGMIWPRHEVERESKLPLASVPAIVTRSFHPQLYSVETTAGNALYSAIRASRIALKQKYDDDAELLITDFESKKNEIGELVQQGEVSQALARIGYEIQAVLKARDREYELAIILPGGYHIFHPSGLVDIAGKNVYIEAYERIHGIGDTKHATCRFKTPL